MRKLNYLLLPAIFATLFFTHCGKDSPTEQFTPNDQFNTNVTTTKISSATVCGDVVLWNKLGSSTEVNNSEIGSDMAILGSPTFESGFFGNAVTFTHYSQYVTTTLWPAGSKHWGIDEITFEFWCRLNSWGHLGFYFDFLNGREADSGFLRLVVDRINSGKILLNNACENVEIPLPYGYDLGVWHHYAIVVTTTQVQFYYDGSLLVSSPLRGSVIGSNMPFQLDLGGEFQHWHTDFHFFGTIDNWIVYDYAKTDFANIYDEQPYFDSDCDGIPDSDDACPGSILEETILIDGCDTGVTNHLLESGCTMSDLIAACLADANNHGQFVRCVSQLTNEWKENGLISGKEKGTIQRCAARSNLP